MSIWAKTDTQVSKPKWITKKITFDASSASVVNLTDNTIVLKGYGYGKGEAVIYGNGGGTDIVGLTNGTTYYIIPTSTPDVYKLATTANNANAGIAIDLTGLGGGTAHTIQALASDVYFVDETEAQVPANKAKGITGAGWWKINSYTDAQSATRWKAECLVALTEPAISAGDAADDLVVADV